MLAQLTLKFLAFCLAISILLLLNSSCSTEPPGPQISGLTMGTSYSVQWTKLHASAELVTIKEKIENRLEEINTLMSTYLPQSQLSGFNLSRETGWHAVEPELAQLITQALTVSEQSQGAFDITVGPLVNLWGFGPSETEFVAPTQTEINIAKRSVGYQHLQARLEPAALNKS